MLKAYMVYSRTAGSQESAALVFAHTAREARIVGWNSCSWDITDEYIDLAVRLLPDKPWIFSEKISDDPHVIDSPKCCEICGLWGKEPYDDKICVDCAEEMACELEGENG